MARVWRQESLILQEHLEYLPINFATEINCNKRIRILNGANREGMASDASSSVTDTYLGHLFSLR
jgi:hypothetical protein